MNTHFNVREQKLALLHFVLCVAFAGCADTGSGGADRDAPPTEFELCDVDPCASSACDQTMLTCPGEPAPGIPDPESPLEPDRTFECEPGGVPEGIPVGQVMGSEGRFISLQHTDKNCQYDLIFHEPGGRQTQISSQSNGYLMTAARHFENRHTIVCVNGIQHRVQDEASSTHFIERVSIYCARRVGESWTPLQPAVSPDDAWAAWLDMKSFEDETTAQEYEDSGTFTLRYTRDFSFQFMNAIDEGRPETDGYYQQSFEWVGDSLARVGQPIRLSSIGEISARAGGDDEPWDPTESEIEEFEAYIESLPPTQDEPMEGGAP